MNEPYLYQTFKQFSADGRRPVYVQVIHIDIKQGNRVNYTLLNLDGHLSTAEVSPAKFSELVEKGVLQEWKPG